MTVEQPDIADVAAVEGGPVELLEHGALEPFAHRVVVRGAGRGAVVIQGECGGVTGELLGDELGAVVGEDSGQFDVDGLEPFDEKVEEVDRLGGGQLADVELSDRPAGVGVDRGQLPDRPDPFEPAHVEGVQTDQIARNGREVAKPVRFDLPGDDAGRGGRERGQRLDPCGAGAKPVTVQDLLHPGLRPVDVTLGEVLEQPAGTQGGSGDGLGQDRFDLVGGHLVGLGRTTSALWHQRREAVAAGGVDPVMQRLACDAEDAGSLGDVADLTRVSDRGDTPLIDNVRAGHGALL